VALLPAVFGDCWLPIAQSTQATNPYTAFAQWYTTVVLAMMQLLWTSKVALFHYSLLWLNGVVLFAALLPVVFGDCWLHHLA